MGIIFEVGNPQRKIITKKEDYINFIKSNNGISNLYRSVYNFKYLKNKNQIDYESAIIDMMFFDCDSERSLDVCKEFTNYLDNEDLQYFLKCSSFDKFPKFQIYVLCDSNIILQNKKNALLNGMIYLARECKLSFGESSSSDLDKATFGDLARICPIVGTYKPKRKSFCINIIKEDLDDIDKLKEKSKNGISTFKVYNNKKFNLATFDKLVTEKINSSNLIVENDNFEIKLDNKFVDCLPPFIKKILTNYKGYCDDYKNRWRVALYMRDLGYPESLTEQILNEYYSKHLNFTTLNGRGTQWDRFVKCKALWYTYHGEFREFPTIQNLLDEGWEITKEDKEAIEKLYGK